MKAYSKMSATEIVIASVAPFTAIQEQLRRLERAMRNDGADEDYIAACVLKAAENREYRLRACF